VKENNLQGINLDKLKNKYQKNFENKIKDGKKD